MEGNLKKALYKYRDLTLRLIEELENENYDALEPLLCARQVEIDSIDGMEYSREEFAVIAEEARLVMLHQKLAELMNIKKDNAKEELNNFNKGKSANKSYTKKFSIDAFYFNKKI